MVSDCLGSWKMLDEVADPSQLLWVTHFNIALVTSHSYRWSIVVLPNLNMVMFNSELLNYQRIHCITLASPSFFVPIMQFSCPHFDGVAKASSNSSSSFPPRNGQEMTLYVSLSLSLFLCIIYKEIYYGPVTFIHVIQCIICISVSVCDNYMD